MTETATWVQSAPVAPAVLNAGFSGLAVSDDGQVILVSSNTGTFGVWFSADGGGTWTRLATVSAAGAAVSADGMKLRASITGSKLMRSDDRGVTWETLTAPVSFSFASDRTATRLFGASGSSTGYLSEDGGLTWSARPLPETFRATAMSADGQVIAASKTAASSKTFISRDGGLTWVAGTLTRNWQWLTLSADGAVLAGTASNHTNVHVTRDDGRTWVNTLLNTASSNGYSVAMDDAGQNFIAAFGGASGYVMRSGDGGATWAMVSELPRGDWRRARLSGDGYRLYAADVRGLLHTLDETPAPPVPVPGIVWRGIKPPAGWWDSVHISDDGRVIAAGSHTGEFVRSTDGGATWSTSWVGFNGYAPLLVGNADGTVYLAGGGATAQFSRDGGLTWAFVPGLTNEGVAGVSVLGDRMAVVTGWTAFLSVDGGATWAKQPAPGGMTLRDVTVTKTARLITLRDGVVYWVDDQFRDFEPWSDPGTGKWLAASADGQKIVSTPSSETGPLNVTTDGGQTWATAPGTTSVNPWFGVDASDDGQVFAGIADGKHVTTSIDGGVSWETFTDVTAVENVIWVAVAAAGTAIAYATGSGLRVGTVTAGTPGEPDPGTPGIPAPTHPTQLWRDLFVGSTPVTAVYYGSHLVWARSDGS